MATNTNQRLAVLIDADNAQASVIQELLAEVSRYGTATIKPLKGLEFKGLPMDRPDGVTVMNVQIRLKRMVP
jgi:hypothetical protein